MTKLTAFSLVQFVDLDYLFLSKFQFHLVVCCDTIISIQSVWSDVVPCSPVA